MEAFLAALPLVVGHPAGACLVEDPYQEVAYQVDAYLEVVPFLEVGPFPEVDPFLEVHPYPLEGHHEDHLEAYLRADHMTLLGLASVDHLGDLVVAYYLGLDLQRHGRDLQALVELLPLVSVQGLYPRPCRRQDQPEDLHPCLSLPLPQVVDPLH